MINFLNIVYSLLPEDNDEREFSAIACCSDALTNYLFDFSNQDRVGLEGKNKIGIVDTIRRRKLFKAFNEYGIVIQQIMLSDFQQAVNEDTIIERDFWEFVFGPDKFAQMQENEKNIIDALHEQISLKYSVSKDNLGFIFAGEKGKRAGKVNFIIDENGFTNINKFNCSYSQKDEKQIEQQNKKSFDMSIA